MPKAARSSKIPPCSRCKRCSIPSRAAHRTTTAKPSHRGWASPTRSVNRGKTVLRAGFGLFFNDLAQNGWVTALQAVNSPLAGPCAAPGDPGCVPGARRWRVDRSNYKTPYAIHVTGGVAHAFNSKWTLSADYTHEQGVHGYAHINTQPARRSSPRFFRRRCAQTQSRISPSFVATIAPATTP